MTSQDARQRAAHDAATLATWFDGALGARVLAAERGLLDERLPDLYGFHLMQLGVDDRLWLCERSMIRHRFLLSRHMTTPMVRACAELEQLPLDTDCIDVIVLHHVLEYSEHPHQLLREAARVVVPHGHLLVLGFNPWSLFGLHAAAGRRLSRHPVWRGATLSARRVTDWLELLDFAIEDVQYCIHLPLLEHARALHHPAPLSSVRIQRRLPMGAVYMIHARKQLSRLTPIRTLRRTMRPRLPALPLVSPSTRDTTLH